MQDLAALAIDKNGEVENGEEAVPTTLVKQSSGNFIEDEGGIWGIGVDKCGCSDEEKRNCTDTDANCAEAPTHNCTNGDEAPTLTKQRSGNFIEDEGGLWGVGVNCSCNSGGADAKSGCNSGVDTKSGSCGNSCGTCTDGSKNHPAAVAALPALSFEDGDRGKIFFASESGTSKKLAERLLEFLKENKLPFFDLVDPIDYEPEDLPKEKVVIVVASTWENGRAPKNASFLAQWLAESSEDFRVGSGILRSCRCPSFSFSTCPSFLFCCLNQSFVVLQICGVWGRK